MDSRQRAASERKWLLSATPHPGGMVGEGCVRIEVSEQGNR